MCGVIGLLTDRPAGPDLVEGLLALQHRGQDSAGIVTSDIAFHLKKGNGTVAEVFNKRTSPACGSDRNRSCSLPDHRPGFGRGRQPFYVNHPFGVAMVHNGNVTNYVDLRRSSPAAT